MKVFAIGDLHLSLSSDKPMDIFGENWAGHFERICSAWNALVCAKDIVLVPGDISWAMRLQEAMVDIRAIGGFTGRKVLSRGNHDYWWNSIARLRGELPADMYAIQNDALRFDGLTIAASRGWTCPGSAGFDGQNDARLYEREVLRAELSLTHAQALHTGRKLVFMLHYPPMNEKRQPSGFTELFERYGVDEVVYGHLHGRATRSAFEGVQNGVRYTLCSADHLDFAPKLIAEL